MTVSIKVGAELDAAQLQQQLAELTRRINAAGQAIAQAGKVQFNPISQATVEQARRVEQTMRNIAKIAPDLAGRVKASGQQGAAFDGLDWSRLYGDPAQRFRAQRNLFSMVTGLGFSSLAPPPGALPVGPGSIIPGRGPGLGSAAADLFEHALRSGGRVGGIAATGLHAGRAAYGRAGGGAGGFGAGLVGGLGAAAGFAAFQGIGALVGAVRQQIGAAEQESIGYADLYRRIGGTGAGNTFGGLRMRVRGASDAIGVSYDEALGLAGMAARRSNLSSARDVAGAVELGGGFARGFGFDPGAGVAAFAGLRGAGVTRSTDEGRRLGLAIAEGIARAGVFAKAEDYLAEVAAYGEQTARATLTRPNVEGFNEALAGLIGQRRPGLDVTGAAAIINRADQAIRRGGAAGEAGQAFLYQAVGRRLGLDPDMVEAMQEGGLFATARNTFGPGTVAGDYYRRAGLNPNADDETTILEMVTGGLRQQYTGPNRRLLANAASNLLGINQRQAMAFLELQPEQLQGMRGLVSEEQLRGLTGTGIAQMGRIATGGRGELSAIATELMGRSGRDALSPDERSRLIAAQQGTDDELRRILAELTASRQAEETEGDRTRRTLLDLDKTMRDMATVLVGPLNTARDALLVLAGRGNGALTTRAVAEQVRVAEMAEANTQAEAQLRAMATERSNAADRLARAQGLAANNAGDPGLAAAADAARGELEAVEQRRAAIIADRERAHAEAQRRFRESTAPRPPGEPRGFRNNNPLNIEDGQFAQRQGGYAGGDGRFARFTSMEEGVAAADALLQSYHQRNGLDTVEGIVRRWAPAADGNNTASYASRVASMLGVRPTDRLDMRDPAVRRRLIEAMAVVENGRPMPAAGRAGPAGSSPGTLPTPALPGTGQVTPMPAPNPQQQSSAGAAAAQHATVTGHFILTDPSGRPLAAPLNVRTAFGAPRPFGALT